MAIGYNLLIIIIIIIISTALIISSVSSDLILSKVDRRVDLTSQVVRVTSTLKVENKGTDPVSEVLLPFPENQAKNLAYLAASASEGKKKSKTYMTLPIQVVHRDEFPQDFTIYSVSLPKKLGEGETLTLDILSVFTHALKPFPEKISQDQLQFVVFQDNAYYISPYVVKVQSLSVKLPQDPKIESYTSLEKTKVTNSEIKYGPYEDIPSFSYSPIIVHFENKQPFAVAQELVREIEISHWGNVQVTEHYNLIHGGAESKGEFSRLDFQARPHVRGAAAFKQLVAKLPPRAHSVYYRDEIGNISTSNLWGDSKKTQLEIEPRYPMLGGWRTSFTIGYGLPLKDFLFQSEGKRFLNISFGSPISDMVTDNLIVKVVLPEGSWDISVSAPFPVEEKSETKFSHLDIVGRPVVVLEKKNVVQDHNQHFQVYYKFSNLSLLQEPLMLISGIFFLFIACIVYMHADLTISKTSASYVARLQWDEVRTVIQQLLSIVNRCLMVHDKIELSLYDLSRTGDVQACKAVRKSADVLLKEFPKELKPLLAFLHSCPQAAQISPKVEELVAKERELQEKLMAKHSTVVECYEKKSGKREAENRVASIQQKITTLRQEVEDLLDVIDEI